MTTALMYVVTIGIIIWVLRAKFAGRRQVHADLGTVASALGLTPGRTPLDKIAAADMAQMQDNAVGRAGLAALAALPAAQSRTYGGLFDGVRVSVAVRAAQDNNTHSLVTELKAYADPAWNLGLKMAQQHRMDRLLEPGRVRRDVAIGDPDFDERVLVEGTDPAAVRALLNSATVRAQVADLLRDVSRSYIDDQGVHGVLTRPVTDAAEVRPTLTKMTALVRALSDARVRRHGPAEPFS
jgi:hypothetical protein